MKTVGILTFQYSDNFGSELQCYALKKSIENLCDYKVEIINYSYLELRNYFETENLKQKFEDKLEKFKKFREKYFSLSGDLMFSINKNNYPKYDYYIVGSDTVWQTPQTNNDATFFLDFVTHDAKKIAYAASSAGNPSINEMLFKKYLSSFDDISVREQSLKENIKKFVSKEVAVTLDPTLLLTSGDYDKLIKNNNSNHEENYILLYLVYGGYNTPYIVNFTNMIARKYNMEIKHFFPTLPGYIFQNKSESFAFAGVEEFLELIKNSSVIITNSFHGTAFSLIYNKPFYSFYNKKGGERIEHILNKCNLTDRMIKQYLPLNKVSFDINWEQVNIIIEYEKKNSLGFLKNALER